MLGNMVMNTHFMIMSVIATNTAWDGFYAVTRDDTGFDAGPYQLLERSTQALVVHLLIQSDHRFSS
jgi:hypothetical protein